MSEEFKAGHHPRRIHRGLTSTIPKGWGKEVVVANEKENELIREKGYCLKFLIFDKANKGSMHFHGLKHETFYILNGTFVLKYMDPATADELSMTLNEGDVVVLPPLNSHQIICETGFGTIVEASSPDHANDSYRVGKGASQTSQFVKAIDAPANPSQA
jgi:mannose-6-phosphate isomerase-like protein (cupin superfamily)